jgi:hypothetical protein
MRPGRRPYLRPIERPETRESLGAAAKGLIVQYLGDWGFPSMRWVTIALLVLLAGCSRTELLYGNADWLAERWVNELIDASAEQQESWRGVFRLAMVEHQRRLLPEVVVLLRRLEADAATGLEADGLRCWVEAADAVYRRHASWAVPAAVAVLRDLTLQQVDHLAAELGRRNEEYRETYLPEDPVARERNRVERYIERIEHWTGALSTGQLRLVQMAVGRMPDLAGHWLDYRRQQQERLLGLLRDRPGEAALQRFLADWWIDFADRPPELVGQAERVREAWLVLIVTLDETLDAAQRATVLDNLTDLREDLEAVPQEGGALQLAWRDIADCPDATEPVVN